MHLIQFMNQLEKLYVLNFNYWNKHLLIKLQAFSCVQGLASSGKSENFRCNIVNPTRSIGQSQLKLSSKLTLNDVEDSAINKTHAYVIASTTQSSCDSFVIDDDNKGLL